METIDFNNKVIDSFAREVTDLIFQYILEHGELMSEYLDLVSKNTRQTVNAQLGKAIKARFNVDNIDKDGNIIKSNPKCILIKTQYTVHKTSK